MYVSGERAGCLRRLLLGRGVACNNCGSVESFIIKSTRWSTTSPLALEVASNCANCGAGTTTPLSLQEARRCGFDPPPSSYPYSPECVEGLFSEVRRHGVMEAPVR